MANNLFKVSFELNNIGPHGGKNKITFSKEVNSNKSIFYATNGTGKSFISRAFRLCGPEKRTMLADDVLTIGENSGQFAFCIDNGTDKKQVCVKIDRGNIPVVNNSSGLIFHVYNSDYVEENIKPKHYVHDGRIEGYILGKAQIDLTKEKEFEKELKEKIIRHDKEIDEIIDDAKKELLSKGVSSSTIEYKSINKSALKDGLGYTISESVEAVLEQLTKLENVPDELPDISFSVPTFNTAFLDKLQSMLEEEYPKSEWDDDFVKNYRTHQIFIERGLDIEHSNDICPFCNRPYDSVAKELILQYKKYRDDKESQVIAEFNQYIGLLEQIVEEIKKETNKINNTIVNIEQIKEYFPSLKHYKLFEIKESESYLSNCQLLIDIIKEKIKNLKNSFKSVNELILSLKDNCKTIINIQKDNTLIVDKINKTKNESKTERLVLRRNLCKATTVCLENSLAPKFSEINMLKADLDKLNTEILKKEQQSKINKRDKVYESFVGFLNYFFCGKYQLDKETFQIKFLGNKIGNNASSILSDGEKNIVAFCWYLAETHTIVNYESDYDKLFFIIDDPISSMDFHYVYAVSQILRDLKSTFNIANHERIWIFTHNTEFFSIISRNHILTNFYLIKPGKISEFDNKLLMPYENHLADIVSIADEKTLPNHTTGNSIRHVIETISKFENPGIGLETYVTQQSLLCNDSGIFSLCQDLSHGNIRNEIPYSDDVLIQACKTVVAFFDQRYPEQVNYIQRLKL